MVNCCTDSVAVTAGAFSMSPLMVTFNCGVPYDASTSASSDWSRRTPTRAFEPGDARQVARGREDLQVAACGRGFVRVVRPERLLADPERADRHLEPARPGRRHRLRGGGAASNRRRACTDRSPRASTRFICGRPPRRPRRCRRLVGTTTTRSTNMTRKSMSTFRDASKKLSTSASSMRLDAKDVDARRQAADREPPVGGQREAADAWCRARRRRRRRARRRSAGRPSSRGPRRCRRCWRSRPPDTDP